MNMRMTTIVFVLVATAATFVGSSPVEERYPPFLCRIRAIIECVRSGCLHPLTECIKNCMEEAVARCRGVPALSSGVALRSNAVGRLA
nr:conotoxin precursor con-ikot-ikot [Conus judaeus]